MLLPQVLICLQVLKLTTTLLLGSLILLHSFFLCCLLISLSLLIVLLALLILLSLDPFLPALLSFLAMKFMNVFARASTPKDLKPDIHGKVIEGFKDKEESMQEMKPLELSAPCESSEQGGKNTVVGIRSLCLCEEDSMQALVVKPMKKEENKPFGEVLSFWKQKEKGET